MKKTLFLIAIMAFMFSFGATPSLAHDDDQPGPLTPDSTIF
ncbi:hypothetical protein [Virgibacillus sp. JSM 102003]